MVPVNLVLRYRAICNKEGTCYHVAANVLKGCKDSGSYDRHYLFSTAFNSIVIVLFLILHLNSTAALRVDQVISYLYAVLFLQNLYLALKLINL